MKKINIFLSSLLLSLIGYSQQAPQFTQYQENRYVLNPAATGVDEYLSGNIGYRKQWAGFGEEPTTIYAGAHKGFRKVKVAEHQPLALRTSRPNDYSFEQTEASTSKIKHGLGGYLLSDNYGKFQKSSFNVSYALHLALNEKINLSFGANVGFNNLKFDDNNILETQNDATYNRFAAENGNRSMLDFNLGTYLYSNNFFAGYSTNQLAGDNISFGTSTASLLDLHHTIMAGYGFEVNEKMTITPSAYLKAVAGAPLSYDVNARVDYDKYFGGVTYRNEDAIAVMAGITFKDMIKLSYSYDIITSDINNYSSGGHEVVLGFMLK